MTHIPPFEANITHHFHLGNDRVSLYIQETETTHRWQLQVNGEKSPVSSWYDGILIFRGYAVVSEYWSNTVDLKPWKPFKVVDTEEDNGSGDSST